MRLIIAGSRGIEREQSMRAILACPFAGEATTVLSGCAKGPDSHGEEWAAERGLPIERYPADWDALGKAAGLIRNREMATKADALLAVWDGKSRGTESMIALAKEADLRRFVWRPPADGRPFLKWAGGKAWFARRAADRLRGHVIARGGRWIEPFLGGGAMALAMGPLPMILGDADRDLIACWKAVVINPFGVRALLDGLEKEAERQGRAPLHGLLRDRFNRGIPEPARHAAAMIWLNRAGFNGLWRRNRAGAYNVPPGTGPIALPSLGDLERAAAAMAQAGIEAAGFAETVMANAGDGDIVYADPPYDGCFAGYGPDGFSAADRRALAGCLRAAWRRGAMIIAHDADTPIVRELYAWADVRPSAERRAIAASGASRARAACVVIAAE